MSILHLASHKKTIETIFFWHSKATHTSRPLRVRAQGTYGSFSELRKFRARTREIPAGSARASEGAAAADAGAAANAGAAGAAGAGGAHGTGDADADADGATAAGTTAVGVVDADGEATAVHYFLSVARGEVRCV